MPIRGANIKRQFIVGIERLCQCVLIMTQVIICLCLRATITWKEKLSLSLANRPTGTSISLQACFRQ